jgi:hypothetical protein
MNGEKPGKLIHLAPPEDLRADRRMAELAQSFPCLRDASGVSPWNAAIFDRWASGPVSHSELITARFVLAVWSPDTAWRCGRFDMMEALSVWDPPNHRAFLEWASKPWWP